MSEHTVLVTGSSSGIGQAICARLLEEGHTVHGLARRQPEIEHRRFHPLQVDLSQPEQVQSELAAWSQDHGDCNAVVSVAGAPVFGNLEEISGADIAHGLAVNLTSHILLTKLLLPMLKRHGSSRLVFIGSEAALRGGKQGTIYCASKFGLRGFALALREECSSAGVHVSLVHPGPVRTPWFDPLPFEPGDDPSQAIEPEDVAEAVLSILRQRPGTVVDEVVLSPLKRVIRRRHP